MMATPVQKFPPPPLMTSQELQKLNRWLLEIQRILNSEGLIIASTVAGLPDNYVQTGNNSADINTLFTNLNALSTYVNSIATTVAAQGTSITALQTSVTALQARNQVLNGVVPPTNSLGAVGDWYADTVHLHIYVKTGAAIWMTII